VHVPKALRQKLDPTAREGEYVGFDLRTHAHVIYAQDSKRLVSSIHVTFNRTMLQGKVTRMRGRTRSAPPRPRHLTRLTSRHPLPRLWTSPRQQPLWTP